MTLTGGSGSTFATNITINTINKRTIKKPLPKKQGLIFNIDFHANEIPMQASKQLFFENLSWMAPLYPVFISSSSNGLAFKASSISCINGLMLPICFIAWPLTIKMTMTGEIR